MRTKTCNNHLNHHMAHTIWHQNILGKLCDEMFIPHHVLKVIVLHAYKLWVNHGGG